MLFRIYAGVSLLGLLLSVVAHAQEKLGELSVDRISSDAIRAATTDPKYLTDWVREVPDHPDIPSPRDLLGYTIGTPGELTQVEDIYRYFRSLDESSERLKVFSLGRSHEGREMLLVAIAAADTILELDSYRSALGALSDPRVTDEAAAAELIGQAKPIYWITAGLHSPELGPPEMVMELAYRLVVEDRQPFRDIRDNVITLITPVLEVDGRARQVDWYRRHIKGKKDYYDLPPRSVPFWGHYTYHDNNRDGIAISQPLTRNYVRGVYHWKPTISLDLHESVPLLYVAGGTGPYNTAISPVTIGEWQALANYEITRLAGMGLTGVWTWGYYTGWYPGYMLWTTNNHNAMGRFYETFGNGSAETMERDLNEIKFAGKEVTSRQWYRPSPPPEKLTWSMRNNTNYMQSGVIASLEMVARNSRMFLENFYQKGVDALSKGSREAPYGFVIANEQVDAGEANNLIEVLRRHAIELRMSEGSAEYGKVKVAKGDLLVLMNQPYGPLARELLSKQKFPKKVEVPPYDDVAWTLGLMMGVEVSAVKNKDVLKHKSRPFAADELFKDRSPLPRGGKVWVIPNRGQSELGPVRFALGELAVLAAESEFRAARETFPAGSLLIDRSGQDGEKLSAVLAESFLEVKSLNKMPAVGTHPVDLPRVAVFQSWTSTQNAGWVRYSLDAAGVPYTLISKDRVGAGNLLQDFDVILIPHMRGTTRLADIIGGIDRKWSPLAYETAVESPNMGHILSSKDITGGVGFKGMAAFEEFVRGGGTMITLGSSGVIPASSGMLHDIQVKRPGDLNTPGSILTARVTNRTSPLTYGYDETTHLFRGNGPIFGVARYNRHLAVLQFGVKEHGKKEEPEDKDKAEKIPLVQSGGIVSGEKKIDGEPALVYTALGKGRVVMFSWNPMHRDVNHHDHGFVYNAMLNWNDLPVPVRAPGQQSATAEP